MRFLVWLERLEEGLIALLLALMTLVTFGQVVARYVFNYSFVWALELVIFLFGGLIFLGMAYGVRSARISVSTPWSGGSRRPGSDGGDRRHRAVPDLCRGRLRRRLTYVGKMYESDPGTGQPIPQWVPRLVLPIGFALLFFRFGQALVRLLRANRSACWAMKPKRRCATAKTPTRETNGMTTAGAVRHAVVFMFLGMPVAIALGLSSLLTIIVSATIPSLRCRSSSMRTSSTSRCWRSLSSYSAAPHDHRRRRQADDPLRDRLVGLCAAGWQWASVMACMLFAAVSVRRRGPRGCRGVDVIAGMVRAAIE